MCEHCVGHCVCVFPQVHHPAAAAWSYGALQGLTHSSILLRTTTPVLDGGEAGAELELKGQFLETAMPDGSSVLLFMGSVRLAGLEEMKVWGSVALFAGSVHAATLSGGIDMCHRDPLPLLLCCLSLIVCTVWGQSVSSSLFPCAHEAANPLHAPYPPGTVCAEGQPVPVGHPAARPGARLYAAGGRAEGRAGAQDKAGGEALSGSHFVFVHAF